MAVTEVDESKISFLGCVLQGLLEAVSFFFHWFNAFLHTLAE